MKTISVNLPEAFVKGLEELVQRGLYANRSEAIRVSVRDLLKRELVEPISYNSLRDKDTPVVPGKAEDSFFNEEFYSLPSSVNFDPSSAPEKPQATINEKSNSSAFREETLQAIK